MDFYFHPCPKPPPRPKKPSKPLKRSRKQIQRKSRFKANTNETKTYSSRRSNESVRIYAMACRDERLRNPTEAERAFAELLRQLGVGFEREHIIYYADGRRFIILDFRLKDFNIGFEIDGSSHSKQLKYDGERDLYLGKQGIAIIRFTNQAVLHRSAEVAEKVREILESHQQVTV